MFLLVELHVFLVLGIGGSRGYHAEYLLTSFVPVQITDGDLMELIRKNVKLTIPYAGAFLKRDDR